ncbi:uncharacterized protein LOC143294308 [Babylonia areolata]|uniref:uncharacterized protein LOC143294308 n=1 Tax=Babylonia areolata TaxID=304850 RepID=UPI003FCF6692
MSSSKTQLHARTGPGTLITVINTVIDTVINTVIDFCIHSTHSYRLLYPQAGHRAGHNAGHRAQHQALEAGVCRPISLKVTAAIFSLCTCEGSHDFHGIRLPHSGSQNCCQARCQLPQKWLTVREKQTELKSFHQHHRPQREITNIKAMVLTQLLWAGHVSMMEDHHLPNIVLYRELSTGHNDRGAPKMRHKNTFEEILSACHTDHRQWSTFAADHCT